MILPKPYMSWSQLSLWERSPDEYKKKYFLDGPSFETRESIFGKKTALMLEQNVKDKFLNKIHRYKYPEHRIEVDIGPVPFLGVLDSFSMQYKRFLEYKTSKNPWTPVMVLRHEQLDCYSLLIKEKYGKVHSTSELIWLETRWKPEIQQVGSREIEGDSNELEFTGRIETFTRTIYEYERKAMKEKIIGIAEAISKDYQEFLKNNPLHEQKSIV